MKFSLKIAGLEGVQDYLDPVEKQESTLEGLESYIDANLLSAAVADNEAIFNGEVSRFGVESVGIYAGLEADDASTKKGLMSRLADGIMSIFKALGRYIGIVIDFIRKRFKKDKVVKEAEKAVSEQAELMEACEQIRKKNKNASAGELMEMYKAKADEMGLTGFGTGAEAEDDTKKQNASPRTQWRVQTFIDQFNKGYDRVVIEAYLPYYDLSNTANNVTADIKKAQAYIDNIKGSFNNTPSSIEDINQSIVNILILMSNTISICLKSNDLGKKLPEIKETPTKVNFIDAAVVEANKGLGDILILMNATGPITLNKIKFHVSPQMSAGEVKARFRKTVIYKTAVEMFNNIGDAIEIVSTYHSKQLSGNGIGSIERVLKNLDFKAGRDESKKGPIEGLKTTLPKFQRIVKLFMKVITTQKLKDAEVESDL